MLPFLGTLMGCALVLFMKNTMSERVRSALLGFAGGIMVAASVWSLLLPKVTPVQSTLLSSASPRMRLSVMKDTVITMITVLSSLRVQSDADA